MITGTLKEFATPRQIEILDAVERAGSHRKAAKLLGIHPRNVDRAVQKVKLVAAMRGYSPDHDMVRACPEPFVVRGVSTFYDDDGNVKGQWVKTRIDDAKREEAIRAAIEALVEDVPREKAVRSPQIVESSLANLFTLTDCHVGMKAWADETGSDWDLGIAEDVLVGAFDHLISSSVNAKTGVVNVLGDFLHFDSLDAVTPQHRNLLDSDSRFPKVVQVAVRILRRIIRSALLKHERVIVVFSEGNHDMASTVWLRHLFSLLFENEKRVTVISDITPYTAIQHGETMICFHHGHLTKNDQLPLLFAASYPKMWGSTTRRYCHTGHKHHIKEKEHNGMTVLQHPTIAARDAYAARGGWIADRSITAITYHDKYGQVARNMVVPEMLRKAA